MGVQIGVNGLLIRILSIDLFYIPTLNRVYNTGNGTFKFIFVIHSTHPTKNQYSIKDVAGLKFAPFAWREDKERCEVWMYHTPHLRGLYKRLVPPRWNETIGNWIYVILCYLCLSIYFVLS
jgi:hypothetical protein